MGIIDNAKEVADLVKKVNDIELYRKIVELEAEIVELHRAKRDLDEKVLELEKVLQQQKVLTFKHPFYFGDKDPIPFCPRCWESETKALHLVGPDRYGDRHCRTCKNSYGRNDGV